MCINIHAYQHCSTCNYVYKICILDLQCACICIYMHIYIYIHILYIYLFISLILLEFNMMEKGLYLEFACPLQMIEVHNRQMKYDFPSGFSLDCLKKTAGVFHMPFPRCGHHRCGIFWAHFSGGDHQLPAFHSSFPVCSGCRLHFAAGIPLWIRWP